MLNQVLLKSLQPSLCYLFEAPSGTDVGIDFFFTGESTLEGLDDISMGCLEL